MANQKTLPFWAINNKHGLIPNGNGALLEVGLFSDFTNRHKIQFAYGISAAGFLSRPDNNVILDQLYASARWRNLRLDLGMIHPKEEHNGISSTNGNFIRSGNSRTFPGYNLNSDLINAGKSLSALNIGLNGQEPLPIEANNLHHSRIISGSFVPKKEEPGPV